MNKNLTPYEGAEPYAFISYSHKDSDTVLAILERLQAAGLKFWYDRGIKTAEKWGKVIADRVKNCEIVIAFHSQNSKKSEHCKDEIYFAKDNDVNKPILSIYLEKFAPDDEIKLAVSRFQAINFYDYPADATEKFYSELLNAELLQPCFQSVSEIKNVSLNPLEFLRSPRLADLKNFDLTAAQKIFPVIFLLDTNFTIPAILFKISVEDVRKAVWKMIKTLSKNVTESVSFKVAAVTLDAKIYLHYTEVENISKIPPFEKENFGSFGASLNLAKNIIENETPANWHNPIIILVTCSSPSDDYEEILDNFITIGRSAESFRIAVGIGNTFNKKVLKKFAAEKQPCSVEDLKKSLNIGNKKIGATILEKFAAKNKYYVKVKDTSDIFDTFKLIKRMIVKEVL